MQATDLKSLKELFKGEEFPFFSFLEDIEKSHLSPYVAFSSEIMRGLDYYTDLVFEVFDLHPDNRRALCGGGTYGSLLTIFNEPALPGVGFGLGDVTLTDFLETHQLMPDFTRAENNFLVACVPTEGVEKRSQIASKLRAQGFKTLEYFDFHKFNKIISFAEKHGCEWLALIEENELKQNQFKLKHLKTKKEVTLSLDFKAEDINKVLD